MNIVSLHSPQTKRPPELSNLYDRMETALHAVNADFEKSIRLAKTLAPLLSDQSSNERHVATISSSAPVHEKVIAILMLGFPNNRAALPLLRDIVHTGTNAMRMAATIAISQMRDGKNNAVLGEILHHAYGEEKIAENKHTLRQAMLAVLGKNSPLVIA